jgi:hypothetical protein
MPARCGPRCKRVINERNLGLVWFAADARVGGALLSTQVVGARGRRASVAFTSVISVTSVRGSGRFVLCGFKRNEVVGEQRMHEFGAALGDEVRAVLLPQTLHVGNVAQEHRALPARTDLARRAKPRTS